MSRAERQPQDAAVVSLQVNGESRELPAGLTLEEALRHLGHEPRLVVLELNGEILPRRVWPEQQVMESDVLEVVTIVGGGS